MAQSKMDAVAMLKADHRKVEDLFAAFEKARTPARKKTLATEICTELTVHATIEEEIFYPACKGEVEEDLLDEAYVEHDGAKVLIAEIAQAEPDAEFYDAKVKVLSEMIKHHVKEEERRAEGLFAEARAAGLDMDALADRLAARKKELMAEIAEKGPPHPDDALLHRARHHPRRTPRRLGAPATAPASGRRHCPAPTRSPAPPGAFVMTARPTPIEGCGPPPVQRLFRPRQPEGAILMKSLAAGTFTLALLTGLVTAAPAHAADLAGRWENGPQGVYYMQVYQVVSRSLERRVYIFRGGRWGQDPEGTIETADIESMHPAWRGSWSFDGANFTLAPDKGPPDVEPVSVDGQGCFSFINGMWCPAAPFTAMIDGRYSGGTSAERMATAADYDFSPDGTYRALKAGSYSNPDGGDADKAGSNGWVTGTYRIEGFTLILNEAGGGETRATAFPAFGNTNTTRPEYIYFGGIMMPRTGD